MRNDVGVFCAGLFLTPIYGFNWQLLEEKVDTPPTAPSIVRWLFYTECVGDGLDWLMRSPVIFYIFPHSSSSVEQLPCWPPAWGKGSLSSPASLSMGETVCCPAVQTQRKPFIAQKKPRNTFWSFYLSKTFNMLKRDIVVGDNPNDEQSPGGSFCPSTGAQDLWAFWQSAANILHNQMHQYITSNESST